MRTKARMTGLAVAVSAGLLLSGCGGDGGGNTGDSGDEKSNSAKDTAGQESGGSEGGGESGGEAGEESADGPVGPVDAAGLKGQWETGSISDGDYVVLGFLTGAVSVVTTDASCSGTYEQDGDDVALKLKCPEAVGFETGTITGSGDGQLTVAWSSGETDVFAPTD